MIIVASPLASAQAAVAPRPGADIAAGQNGFIREIADGDEMYSGNQNHYFAVGASALRCICSALSSVQKQPEQIRRVLDLPCGHGRVLRHLKTAFPQAELTACDLNQGGVDFCAKTFGAQAVYSRKQVDRIQLPGKYDLIWSGSLLTHLPLDAAMAFIRLFSRHLIPGGLVVLSLHGRWVARNLATGRYKYCLANDRIAPLLEEFHMNGSGYADYFFNDGYGVSLTSPACALSKLAALPDMRLVSYHERAWDNHQDVLCLQKQPPSELLG